MSPTLTPIVDRLHQIRQARQERINAALDAARAGNGSARGTFIAGDRVFDTITGQEGEVAGTTRENLVVHPRGR
jgi:hypothetical protein